MINWDKLLSLRTTYKINNDIVNSSSYWRKEATESICELYYTQYKNKQKNYHFSKYINQKFGADYNKFIESHINPLEKYNIWEALFPNIKSTLYASALDEALHLIADTKLIDRVYAGDLITVKKIIFAIRRKRTKYLDTY